MQLKQLFPSLIRHTTFPTAPHTSTAIFYDGSNHCWYEILKSEISARDILFLTQFLEEQTEQHNPWYLLLTQGIVIPNKSDTVIRVLQYATKSKSAQLNYAVELFFMNDALLIEAAPQTFWIILFKDYSLQELESFIAILENDFYIHGQLFIGQPHLITNTVHTVFSIEQRVFQTIQKYYFETICTFTNSLLFLLPSFLEMPVQHYLRQTMNNHFNEEISMTISALFSHNGNVSAAAKELHLHRNTLLYRLQRFYDETSLDLRRSEDLLIAYLSAQLFKLTEFSL
ncbi:PucR family transcriptional regulator [Solibacillus silvestris]|uniref:PucR family transcriptional regulator n=1 Tax=Solibacillus silvestris TaxID=76853 RepID=UPI003F8130FE